MRRTILTVLTILTVSLLTGCDFITNSFQYKDKTKEFIEVLLTEDYNKCISLMAMDHENAKNANIDSLKSGFSSFRQLITSNWGTELEYSFIKSEKRFSTVEDSNTPPNTTLALIEFHNEKEFGVLEVLFDDKSQKILSMKPLDVKAPIPTMTNFWLFGLIAICIPLFNIYVIRQIKRSDLKKKWIKYIAVIFLNTPSITYAAVSGFSFQLINLQIFLGVSFSWMGYLNSYWTIGIPLGGLYWFWKLRRKEAKLTEIEISTGQHIETESTTDIDKPVD
ncbi:hypothetical protein [Sphingobacterium corticibacter]|nr:hypothetical protein [Sphingobacterium corticibacter]